MQNLLKLIKDSRGATAIEYALIASLLSVAAITAFNNLGTSVQTKFNAIDQKI